MLSLWCIGSVVYVGKDIPATVTGVNIRANAHVMYECVWWDGRTRNTQWFEEFEVTTNSLADFKISFTPVPKEK